MNHQMNLNHFAWEQIKSGRKTAEIRLYDERKRKIKIGDTIEFIDLDNKNTLSTKVVELSKAPNFVQLFKIVDPYLGGWQKGTAPEKAAKDMGIYYSKEKELEYGVIAIYLVVL